jgi:hypothetical protein
MIMLIFVTVAMNKVVVAMLQVDVACLSAVAMACTG